MRKPGIHILALGGLAGPVLFTLTSLICAGLRPGYNHIHQFISELAATGTPNADLMNWAGFIPSGLLIALFGTAAFVLLPQRFLTRMGSILIILFGLGMTVVGFFSCDEGCPRQGSLENNIHDQISGPVFLCMIVGMLLLGISFRKISFLSGFWFYSVVSALACVVFISGLIQSIESTAYTGLWQRLLLFTIFLWLILLSLRLSKHPGGVDKNH